MYSRQQLRYLEAMGIPAWMERGLSSPHQSPAIDAGEPEASSSSEASSLSVHPGTAEAAAPSTASPAAISPEVPAFVPWLEQQRLVAINTGAAASLTGPANSSLLLLSDGHADPGDKPFAGQSSRLLQAMLQAIKLSRSEVLLGLTEAAPTATAATLHSVLNDQGADSLRVVLFYTCPGHHHGNPDLDNLREKTHQLSNGLPCIVSYHPNCLLEQAELKRAAWNDLKRVRQLLD